MWNWLDKIPLLPLVVGALLLGAAPFVPEPHLVEKLRMLLAGELARPIDVFDLLFHGLLPLLLLLKLGRMAAVRTG
ncbi:MAG: RND transporter [Gammaproteobacteria bacterium]|nr:RND transporter [Gammaproteobacteria bacterium]